MKHSVVIVAGGKGLRMGGDLPKQYITVAGVPILMRTIQAFHQFEIGRASCRERVYALV